jgi:5-methylcytosine-specific restriction endonuclease McrA
MPRAACTICGGPAVAGTSRCGLHPRAATPSQRRAYRGLAAYRAFRARIIDRDAGLCAVCGQPGADELGHRTPYVEADPATRDDPTKWDEADFAAVHDDCNKRLGARPMPN